MSAPLDPMALPPNPGMLAAADRQIAVAATVVDALVESAGQRLNHDRTVVVVDTGLRLSDEITERLKPGHTDVAMAMAIAAEAIVRLAESSRAAVAS